MSGRAETRARNLRPAVAVAIALVAATVSGAAPGRAALHTSVVSADPDDLTPHVLDGEVLGYAQIGNRIYVGGTFTQIRNFNTSAIISRPYLFAYDATTGLIDNGFAPTLNNKVNAIDTDGVYVFAGGSFTSVNGATRNRLAKLDAATGAPTSWNGNANGTVDDLVVRNGTLFAGGAFTKLKNVTRLRLGALSTTNAALDADLALTVDRPGWSSSQIKVSRLDVSADGTRLVVAGPFNTVAGQSRLQIAMIDRTTSPDSVSPWHANYGWSEPSPGFTCIHDVPFSPAGDYFIVSSMCGQHPLGDAVARFETANEVPSAIPTWVDWTGWDTEWGAAVSGEAVYVGGHQRSQNSCMGCSETSAGAVPRSGIAALDPLNGVPLSWNPGRDRGVGAKALLTTATGLLVGSDTSNIGGEWHPRTAFFPLAGGVDIPVEPRPVLPGLLYRGDTSGSFEYHKFDGTNTGGSNLDSSPINWTLVRGAFFANGRVYYGSGTDGGFKSRTWDGTNWGPEVNVLAIPGYYNAGWINFWGTNALTYDGGWMYEVVGSQLRRRGFSLESQIIGSTPYPAGAGYNWANVRAMAIADTSLFFTTIDGNLHRMAMSGVEPVVATDTVIGGPGVDGADYASNALFVRPS